ncbi:hypothetical protein IWX90DRAFT_233031 [Phyllosticta citrichinensis]|uniref:Uncharacterized protein n=1 Tax=Phyllosticta citrichinensis TaxID=1130410 RepID=A0ABR1XUR9_9PEZI
MDVMDLAHLYRRATDRETDGCTLLRPQSRKGRNDPPAYTYHEATRAADLFDFFFFFFFFLLLLFFFFIITVTIHSRLPSPKAAIHSQHTDTISVGLPFPSSLFLLLPSSLFPIYSQDYQ